MERGVRLAGAGRHREQGSLLALGHGLDRAVDREPLVVARRLAADLAVVRRGDELLDVVLDAPPDLVPAPQLGTGRELVEREVHLRRRVGARLVVEDEPVTVRREHERHIETLRVIERLLHAGADGVLVVLRLDHSDRDVRLVEEQVVGASGFAASDEISPDDHLAVGEPELPAPLLSHPPSALQRRGDVPITDV